MVYSNWIDEQFNEALVTDLQESNRECSVPEREPQGVGVGWEELHIPKPERR